MNNRTSDISSSIVSFFCFAFMMFGFFVCCGMCGGQISINKAPKKDYIKAVRTSDAILEEEQIKAQEAHDEQQYQRASEYEHNMTLPIVTYMIMNQ